MSIQSEIHEIILDLSLAYETARAAAYRGGMDKELTTSECDFLRLVKLEISRPIEIQHKLRVEAPSISNMASKLGAKKYLAVQPDPHDGRMKSWVLTMLGKEVLERAMKLDYAVYSKWLRQERETLIQLKKVMGMFDDGPPKPRKKMKAPEPFYDGTHPVRAKFRTKRGAALKAWTEKRQQRAAHPGVDVNKPGGYMERDDDDQS